MAEAYSSSIRLKIKAIQQMVRHTALLMVGIPDYDTYLAHMRAHHPELKVMSRAEFIKRAQECRYAGKKLNKCPC